MKNQIKEKARVLYDDNRAPKEIAQELIDEVSQATVYRWINEFENESDFLHGIVDDEPKLKEHTDLGEVDSDELEGIDDDLSGFDDEDDQAGIDDEHEIDHHELEDTNDEKAIRKRKRSIEKKIKKLFNAILSHSSGHEWSHSQIRRMLMSLNSVQENIEDLYDYEPDVFKQNSFWTYLDSFIGLFQSFSNAGGDVELNFDEELKDEINVVLNIEEFDEAYDLANVMDTRLARLKNDLAAIDNQKIDAEKAYDFQTRINGLIDALKENDAESTYREELISLKGLKKDFKRLSVEIEESFWGSVRFEMDEDLLVIQK